MFINEYTNILHFNVYNNMYIYDGFRVETDKLFTYIIQDDCDENIYEIVFSIK